MENQEIIHQHTDLISQAIASNAPIEVLERLMKLKYEHEAREAEKAYNQAMSVVQAQIAPVQAKLRNKQTNSLYAGIVDIDKEIRPHYSAHGIALSFDTQPSPLPEHIRVIAFITHSQGHKETRHIDIPCDGKGAKGGDVMTKTHAVVSATTYGQRTLTKMIFNVATGEFDDDGNKAGGQLSDEEIQDLQKSKLVELSAELESDLTDADKKNVSDIITNNRTEKYGKAINLLKMKKQAIEAKKQSAK